MHVLGINAYHNDVSAALLEDGRLVAALEEERFRRIKHYAGFPTEAIRRCLAIANISGADVEHVAVSRNPRAHLLRKGLFVATHRPSPRLLVERYRNSRKFGGLARPLADALDIAEDALPRVHHVEHHAAHLASSFFASPFVDAACVAVDGFGDFVSTSVGVGNGSQLSLRQRVYFPHSLGLFYMAITQHLGFPNFGDEFKVMGLAPYGRPEFVTELRQLVRLERDGLFRLPLEYYRHWSHRLESVENGVPAYGRVASSRMEDLLGPARVPGEELLTRHEDLACSLQQVYEECVTHVLRSAYAKTGNPRLCLAGGCAMNSVANGKIRSSTPFQEVYIQPAAGDNGTSLGAALYVWNHVLEKPRNFVMAHGFWGTEYGDVDVEGLLGEAGVGEGLTVDRLGSMDETCRATARLVADGNVVGWYQGRMEWGARALGNRSIVADPRRPDMRDLINTKIKFREKFRPFAPSVLEEAIGEYFEDAVPDPFMLQVYAVRPEKRTIIPAVTHVDGSGRLQTVNPEVNPSYCKLIEAFRDLTGVPIVLNTSFNENEPIVDTPEQALDCFLRTRMDAIVVNTTIVRRA